MNEDVKDMALDLVAELFRGSRSMRDNSEQGLVALRLVIPWATDQQAADIFRYLSLALEAIKTSDVSAEEGLRRAEINSTTASGYALAKAAGKL